jgi:hypothetical protein
MRPDFLVVNYPRGAAGKFLISLLIASDNAAHYDPSVIDTQSKIDYIRESFTYDFSSWLLKEPADKLAWNISFVSNFYPRGNNLSVTEFDELASEHCTTWYHESVKQRRKIVIPWHKDFLPAFLGRDVLSISLDKQSLGWFTRSVWAKHYGIVDGMIHVKGNDPSFYRADRTNHTAFNNPIYLDQSRFSFIKDNIYRSNETKFFSGKENLLSIGSKMVIELGDLLDINRLESKLDELYNMFGLMPIDQRVVREGFAHWRSLHEY